MYPSDLPLYARLWCGVLQPGFERLRGKITPRVEILLGRSQWFSPEQLADFQWRQMAMLLAWARDQVPFYRRWFSENQVTVDELVQSRDLSPLPLVDKTMLTADPQDFQAQPMPAGSYAKATGGTLGQPLRFMLDRGSDNWRNAVSRRGYAWAGVTPGRSQVHVWSTDLIPLGLQARAKRGLHRLLMRQSFISYYQVLSPRDVDQALDTLNRRRPDCLVIYPSAAETLCRRALERGWRPRRPPRSVLTGAETLFAHQRQMLEEVFSCPVFETYGSREFMLIGAECPAHQGMHVSAENLMVEVLKDGRPAADGQLGEVVITDLHNLAQPFIRYRVGDVATWRSRQVCSCGRALPRLGQVEGKVVDTIQGPDGRFLTGHFFPHLLKDFPAILRYQVEQDRPDHLVIRLKLGSPLAPADRDLIIGKFRSLLPGVEPEIEEVDEVKIAPSGKVRVTIGLAASRAQRGPISQQIHLSQKGEA